MTIDLAQAVAHDPEDPTFRKVLAKLQGNILKGHGRDHVINLFVRFTAPSADAIRNVLVPLSQSLVTSALKQHQQTEQMKRLDLPGDLFANIFFTAAGYRALGFSDTQINAAFPEKDGDEGVQSKFRDGMATSRQELGDPPTAEWDATFREPIDMLILLADDDLDFVRRRARDLANSLSSIAEIVGTEHGDVLRDENGEGIEHFGYADGRSQPIYLTTDLAQEGPVDAWSPVEPLARVLVPDLAANEAGAFGSYYVFRKLEQNVLGFMTRERELADALGLQGSDRERAGAMAVGRFRDGTPLALSQVDGFLPVKENNFRFDGEHAAKCPFHAHIRKTNPRGDTGDDRTERTRRITRRGIPYGTRARAPHDTQNLSQLPTKGVGLLFSCFQADIANQFSFMQKVWVNASDFPHEKTGQDPLIANPESSSIAQTWPIHWGQPQPTKTFDFRHFVTMKGGEFFFAPSIPFLAKLAP